MGFEIQNHVLIKYTEEPDVTEITVPDSVTKIGYGAFYDCVGLEKVNLPAGLIQIEAGAFEDCTSLTHIDIPDSVEEIGSSAFFGTNIREIIIPESVKFIGSCAVGAPDSDFGWINLIFQKNQKITRIMIEVLWLGYAPEFRLMDFFENPSYENFSALESEYKMQVAVSYYDTDAQISKYLKRVIKKAVSMAVDREDLILLEELLHTDFITKKNIDSMIEYAIQHTQKTGNAEAQVMLMNYKNQNQFYTDINHKLKL